MSPDVGEFATGVDPELGEHLAQVPLDRAWTDEELRADLRIREALAREPRDLFLLRSELVARVVAALAHQLAAAALGERLHPDRGEHVVGGAQLLARV